MEKAKKDKDASLLRSIEGRMQKQTRQDVLLAADRNKKKKKKTSSYAVALPTKKELEMQRQELRDDLTKSLNVLERDGDALKQPEMLSHLNFVLYYTRRALFFQGDSDSSIGVYGRNTRHHVIPEMSTIDVRRVIAGSVTLYHERFILSYIGHVLDLALHFATVTYESSVATVLARSRKGKKAMEQLEEMWESWQSYFDIMRGLSRQFATVRSFVSNCVEKLPEEEFRFILEACRRLHKTGEVLIDFPLRHEGGVRTTYPQGFDIKLFSDPAILLLPEVRVSRVLDYKMEKVDINQLLYNFGSPMPETGDARDPQEMVFDDNVSLTAVLEREYAKKFGKEFA